MKYETLNYCYKKTFNELKQIILHCSNFGVNVHSLHGIPLFVKYNLKLTKEYKCCEVFDLICNSVNVGLIYVFKELIFVKYCNRPYLFYYNKMILPIVLKKYKRYLK